LSHSDIGLSKDTVFGCREDFKFDRNTDGDHDDEGLKAAEEEEEVSKMTTQLATAIDNRTKTVMPNIRSFEEELCCGGDSCSDA
jgi:hypothetical protein